MHTRHRRPDPLHHQLQRHPIRLRQPLKLSPRIRSRIRLRQPVKRRLRIRPPCPTGQTRPKIQLHVGSRRRNVQTHLIHQTVPDHPRPDRLTRPPHQAEREPGRGAQHDQTRRGAHHPRPEFLRPPPRRRHVIHMKIKMAARRCRAHHLKPQVSVPVRGQQRSELATRTPPRRQPRPGDRQPERLRRPIRRVQKPGHPTHPHGDRLIPTDTPQRRARPEHPHIDVHTRSHAGSLPHPEARRHPGR